MARKSLERPLPFSKGVFIWGDPVYVERGASETDMANARQQVEDQLTAISNRADALCGQTSIEPDPTPADRDDSSEEASRGAA